MKVHLHLHLQGNGYKRGIMPVRTHIQFGASTYQGLL